MRRSTSPDAQQVEDAATGTSNNIDMSSVAPSSSTKIRRSSSRSGSRKSGGGRSGITNRGKAPPLRIAPHASEYPLLHQGVEVLLDPIPNCTIADVALLADNKHLVTVHVNGIRVFQEEVDSGGKHERADLHVPVEQSKWNLVHFRDDPLVVGSFLCVPFTEQPSLSSSSSRFTKYFAVASGDDRSASYTVSVLLSTSSRILLHHSCHKEARVTSMCLTCAEDVSALATSSAPFVLSCDELQRIYFFDVTRERAVQLSYNSSVTSLEAFGVGTVVGLTCAATCSHYCAQCAPQPSASSSRSGCRFVVYVVVNIESDEYVEHRTIVLHVYADLKSPRVLATSSALLDVERDASRQHATTRGDAQNLIGSSSSLPFGMSRRSPAVCLAHLTKGSASTVLVARPRLRLWALVSCCGALNDEVRVYRDGDMSNGLGTRSHDELAVAIDTCCRSELHNGIAMVGGEQVDVIGRSEECWESVAVIVTSDGACLLVGFKQEEAAGDEASPFSVCDAGRGGDGDEDHRARQQLEHWLDEVQEDDTSSSSSSPSPQRSSDKNAGRSSRNSTAKSAAAGTNPQARPSQRPLKCDVLFHLYCPLRDAKSRGGLGSVQPRYPVRVFHRSPGEAILLLSDETLMFFSLPLCYSRARIDDSTPHSVVAARGASASISQQEQRRLKPQGQRGSLLYLVSSPFHHMVVPQAVDAALRARHQRAEGSSADDGAGGGGDGNEAPSSITRSLMKALHSFAGAPAASSVSAPFRDKSHGAGSQPPPEHKTTNHGQQPSLSASAGPPSSNTLVANGAQPTSTSALTSSAGTPIQRVQQAEIVVPVNHTKIRKKKIIVVAPATTTADAAMKNVPSTKVNDPQIALIAAQAEPDPASYVQMQIQARRAAVQKDLDDHRAEDHRLAVSIQLQQLIERCEGEEEVAGRNSVTYAEAAALQKLYLTYFPLHEAWLKKMSNLREQQQQEEAQAIRREQLPTNKLNSNVSEDHFGNAANTTTSDISRQNSSFVVNRLRYVSDDLKQLQGASVLFLSRLRELQSSQDAGGGGGNNGSGGALPPLNPAVLFSAVYFDQVVAPLQERDRCQFELEDLRAQHRDEIHAFPTTEVIRIFENQRLVPAPAATAIKSTASTTKQLHSEQTGSGLRWEPFARLPFQNDKGSALDPKALDAGILQAGDKWIEQQWATDKSVLLELTKRTRRKKLVQSASRRADETRRGPAQDTDNVEAEEDDEDVQCFARDWDGWIYAERWPAIEPGDGYHWSRTFMEGLHMVRRRCLRRTHVDSAAVRKRDQLARRHLKEEEELRRQLAL